MVTIEKTQKSHDTFNTASTASSVVADKAIYIATPASENSNVRSYVKTFNAVAESPAPNLVGQVQNMGRFSQPLTQSDEFLNVDLAIKAPDTGFYIPPEYNQFIPEIEHMIERYYKLHEDDATCIMSVRQGIIEPDTEAAAPFKQTHKDLNLSRIASGEGAPNSLVLIASSALTTGFSTHKLSENEIKELENAEDPDQTFEDILARTDIAFETFDHGSITEHSASSIHAIANPKEPTQRTAVILAFHPKEEPLPEQLNNPWLETAIKETNSISPEQSLPIKNI